MNIINLTQGEFQENVPFSLRLVEKGNTLKVTTDNGIVCIVSPVASVAQDPEKPDINIPTPEDFVPDPVGTRTFVDGALREMTQGF
jgi:hypothetical protein|tara:strand:- start:280 stop:537 length:258 start_codon:yes stop_codon:yes gene_type:complete